MNGASNPAEERLDNDYADLDCQAAVDESETGSVDQSESISSKQLSLQELPPRPKTPEDINSKSNEIGKIVEALKQIGKQNEYLKNGLDETKNKTNNTNMGLVTLIDVLKKLNLKLEAETEMRLQLEEKVDRQQQEPVLSLIQGLVLHILPDPKHFYK